MTNRYALQLAFDRVIAGNSRGKHMASDKDWRGEIDSTVDVAMEDSEDALRLMCEAITYFTGTEPEARVEPSPGRPFHVRLRLMSEGYRMGPCGP